MKIFKHFPTEDTCPLCGTSEDRPCTLIPIDETSDGRFYEVIPVHVNCVTKGDLRFNREANIFCKVAVSVS